jgi:hypothetical protein
MARITPGGSPNLGLEDDQLYQGVLLTAKFSKSNKPEYPDQVLIEWELRQGVKLRDYIGLSLGLQAATKKPSKLRQLLNALAEKPADDELWFDADTMEWGYDLDGDDSTPAYAALTPGMVVQFKGENRKTDKGTFYKVTGYKAPKGSRANGA